MLDEVIGEEDYKKYNVEMDDDANFNCVIDDLENGIKLTFSETDGQDSVYRITVLSSH